LFNASDVYLPFAAMLKKYSVPFKSYVYKAGRKELEESFAPGKD